MTAHIETTTDVAKHTAKAPMTWGRRLKLAAGILLAAGIFFLYLNTTEKVQVCMILAMAFFLRAVSAIFGDPFSAEVAKLRSWSYKALAASKTSASDAWSAVLTAIPFFESDGPNHGMFKTRNIPIALIALGGVWLTTMPLAFAASTIIWVVVQVLVPTAIMGSIWAFGPTAVIYGFAIIGFYEWFHSPDSGGGHGAKADHGGGDHGHSKKGGGHDAHHAGGGHGGGHAGGHDAHAGGGHSGGGHSGGGGHAKSKGGGHH